MSIPLVGARYVVKETLDGSGTTTGHVFRSYEKAAEKAQALRTQAFERGDAWVAGPQTYVPRSTEPTLAGEAIVFGRERDSFYAETPVREGPGVSYEEGRVVTWGRPV